MRFAIIVSMIVGLAIRANAEPQTQTAANEIQRPLSIWQDAADGALEHVQSSILCPKQVDQIQRDNPFIFDPYGLDVGCRYINKRAIISYFFAFHPSENLDKSIFEAKNDLEFVNKNAHPVFESQYNFVYSGLDWTRILYRADNDVTEAIWASNMYGWHLSARFTYKGYNHDHFNSIIGDFSDAVVKRSGPRLKLCKEALVANRQGKQITKKSDLKNAVNRISILGGAFLAMAADDSPKASVGSSINCVESAGTYAEVPMVFWRSISAGGYEEKSDKITIVTTEKPLPFNLTSWGTADFLMDKGNPSALWALTLQQDGNNLIYGVFRGRPSLDQVGNMVSQIARGSLKPIGGYGANGKGINVILP